MMKKIISNALSVNMLPPMEVGEEMNLKIERIEEPSAEEKSAMHSCVGHPDTAAIMGVPANRESVTIDCDTELVVGQYIGPRLEPGTTELPQGARIDYFKVTITTE